MMCRVCPHALCAFVITGLVLLGPGSRMAHAELISTAGAASVVDARGRALSSIDRQDVRAQLASLGVDPDEARARVAALSDTEIVRLDQRIADLPAGEGAVGAVVGALLIVFLVLLFTDLLGLTDVFTFVKKPVRR